MATQKYLQKYRYLVNQAVFEQLLQKYLSCDIMFEPIEGHFTEAEQEDLYAKIDESSFLSSQQKFETIIGLMMIMMGSFPEPAIVSHLGKVFGKEFLETLQTKQKTLGSPNIPKGNRIDTSPRRILFGATIPGKKMTAMLEPYMPSNSRLQRGRFLLDLYKYPHHLSLMYVALSLHILPKKGVRFGPAFREIVKGGQSPSVSLYGAILTDIRDFLKFRFRATGLGDAKGSTVLESLKTGVLPVGVEILDPEQVIQYTISALDVLSRETQFSSTDSMTTQMQKLKALLRVTAELFMDTSEKQAWDDLFKYCQ